MQLIGSCHRPLLPAHFQTRRPHEIRIHRGHIAMLALSLLAFMPPALAFQMSCHIHPPADAKDSPSTLPGGYTSEPACQAARRSMFGESGRCHCMMESATRLRRSPGIGAPDPAPGPAPGADGAPPLMM